MNEIIKLELLKYPQGFEWGGNAVKDAGGIVPFLYPIGDQDYDNLENIEFIPCPPDLWSKYLQCGKGRWDQSVQTNLVEFANKYGFDRYLVLHKDITNISDLKRENICPPSLDIIKLDMQNLQQAHLKYLEMGTFYAHSLDILNGSAFNLTTEFTKEGLFMESHGTHSNIWLTWYQSVMKGHARLCSVCKLPFYSKRKNADVCGGTCRNLKSKGSK